jgi:putrescine aminotransferase
MKLALLYTGKPGFIATIRGFHGKSYGAISLMGKAEYRKGFEPLLEDVYFVPFGDADAVEEELRRAQTVGLDIAAVIAEPVQGEAGAIVPRTTTGHAFIASATSIACRSSPTRCKPV